MENEYYYGLGSVFKLYKPGSLQKDYTNSSWLWYDQRKFEEMILALYEWKILRRIYGIIYIYLTRKDIEKTSQQGVEGFMFRIL